MYRQLGAYQQKNFILPTGRHGQPMLVAAIAKATGQPCGKACGCGGKCGTHKHAGAKAQPRSYPPKRLSGLGDDSSTYNISDLGPTVDTQNPMVDASLLYPGPIDMPTVDAYGMPLNPLRVFGPPAPGQPGSAFPNWASALLSIGGKTASSALGPGVPGSRPAAYGFGGSGPWFPGIAQGMNYWYIGGGILAVVLLVGVMKGRR